MLQYLSTYFKRPGLTCAQADKVRTIEGSTNGKGERDSVTGDGVWLKSRDRTLTKSDIRIFR